jgi:hypothetical protein
VAASCRFTADGRAEQLARYARLSASVLRVDRAPRSISVSDPHDAPVLETLAQTVRT